MSAECRTDLTAPPWTRVDLNAADIALCREVERLTTVLMSDQNSEQFLAHLAWAGGDPDRYLRLLCGVTETIVEPGNFGVEDGPGIAAFGPVGQSIARAFASFAYAQSQFWKADAFTPISSDPEFAQSLAAKFRFVPLGLQIPCGAVSFCCLGVLEPEATYVVFRSGDVRYGVLDLDEFRDRGLKIPDDSEPALLVFGYQYDDNDHKDMAKGDLFSLPPPGTVPLGLPQHDGALEIDDDGPFWEVYEAVLTPYHIHDFD